MVFPFREQETACWPLCCSGTMAEEFTGEAVIPDAQPDAERIADVSGTLLMKGKELAQGKLTVSGTVSASALYCAAGESRPYKVEAQIPFSLRTDYSGEITGARICAELRLTKLEANLANSRKLRFTAGVAAAFRVYRQETKICPQPPRERGEAELLEQEVTFCAVTGVTEKTFTFSGEVPLSGAVKPEILRIFSRLSEPEGKQVGTKLIVRGTGQVSVAWMEEGALHFSQGELEFSQILETPLPEGAGRWRLAAAQTGIFAGQPLGGSLPVELDVALQAVTAENVTVSYAADAACPTYALQTEEETLSFEGLAEPASADTLAQLRLSADPPAEKIIEGTVFFSPVRLSAGEKGRGETEVRLSVLYTAVDGSLHVARGSALAEAELPVSAGSQPMVTVSNRGELFLSPVGSEIEARLPVVFTAETVSPVAVTALKSYSYDENEPLELSQKPSLICLRAGEGDTVWSLAKAFSSTTGLIRQANELEQREPEIGAFLIIPRKT